MSSSVSVEMTSLFKKFAVSLANAFENLQKGSLQLHQASIRLENLRPNQPFRGILREAQCAFCQCLILEILFQPNGEAPPFQR